MKQFNPHRIFLALFAVLVLDFGATGVSRADNYLDCMTAPLRQRVAPCSAVIDDPATAAPDRERALQNRSADYLIAKRYADAIQDLNAALAINPQSALSLNGRAWTLYRWKNTTEGMDDVNASLSINGSYAAAWDTRAHFHQVLKQFDEAFNHYEAAIGFGGQPFIRTYQCGLKERGLYTGPADGIYSTAVRDALRKCAFSATCDPLPENEYEEECNNATS